MKMNEIDITSAKYVLNPKTNENESIAATIYGKSIGVPLDPANRHYAEIMRQVEAGTLVIEPADEPEGQTE
jgi:hypothetical protein